MLYWRENYRSPHGLPGCAKVKEQWIQNGDDGDEHAESDKGGS